MAVSGLSSDARQIAETARSEAASYRTQYGIGIPLKYLNDRVSMYMHAYTLYSAVRPYGCSVIVGAYEADGPAMYMIDPSGVSYGYYGCAIGENLVVVALTLTFIVSGSIEFHRMNFIAHAWALNTHPHSMTNSPHYELTKFYRFIRNQSCRNFKLLSSLICWGFGETVNWISFLRFPRRIYSKNHKSSWDICISSSDFWEISWTQ